MSIAVWVGIAYLAGLIYDRIGDTLLERIEKRQRLELAIDEWEKKPASRDPYPEDAYRAAVLARGEDIARQYNYFRTRVRLTRALASLLPAATVAMLVHRNALSGWLVTFDVIAAYGLVATINTVMPRLPRTNEAGFATYIEQTKRWRTAYASSIAGLLALVALMCVAARDARDFAIIGAGVAATVLAAWVWIRITGTFMAFLRDAA